MEIDEAARTLNELHPPPPSPPPPSSPSSSDALSSDPQPPAPPAEEEVDYSFLFTFPPLVPLSSSASASLAHSDASVSLSPTPSSSLSSPSSPSPSSPSSSKKLLITPHNNKSAITSINKTWNEFESNLADILRHMGENKVEWTDNWGSMYRHIFTLKTITRDVAHLRLPLYLRFEKLLVFYVEEQLSLQLDLSDDSFVFLRSYLGKWCGYAIAIKYIHDIFGMHYFWVKDEQLPDIFTYGLKVWREHMFAQLAPHLSRAVATLLTLIRDNSDSLSSHQVRDLNLQILPSLIRNQVVMAPSVKEPLTQYNTWFLAPYVECTRNYFQFEARSIIGDACATNVSLFMQKAELCLDEELKRLRAFESAHKDEDDAFPDLYHALLHSCWYVCESMSTVDESFTSAVESLTEQVRTTLHEVLVANNYSELIAACPPLFNDGKWEDLNRMLRLLILTNSSHLLEQKMKDHIADVGISIVDKFETNPKKDIHVYADSLYAIMTHYRTMAHSFPHHKFVQIIDQAFETILNKSKNSCRYIAQYVDSILRASVRQSGDSAHIEEALDKTADFLNYLQDKDIFIVYYVHYLARRLLDPDLRSVDNDYEKQMLGKIKLNHGKSFTSKMEQMLRDVTLSQDIGRNFNLFIRQEKGEIILPELSPTIVETGAWPSSVLRDPGGGGECFLPLEVDGAWFSFKAYYLSMYSGRRLVFTPHLGTAEVSIRLGNKNFTATMSSFAMCVLLLFEHTNVLSFSDILSMTNISAKALKFTLKALSTPVSVPAKKGAKKHRGPSLLQISTQQISTTSNTTTAATTTTTASNTTTNNNTTDLQNMNTIQNLSETDDIPETALVSLNLNFGAKCTAKRFKVSLHSAATTQVGSNNEVDDGLKKKREWQVDCIVVRVMKTRRLLQHNALIQEVITQSSTHFIPTVQLIKLRIQALIDREFIARDPEDRTTYIYLE